MSTDPEKPAPTPVTLPALPEVRKWIDGTRAQREALQTRAARVREKFEPLRKELAGIERSIKVLDHFLAQVATDGLPDDQTSGDRAKRTRLLNGRWSRKHDACVVCGRDDSPHKGHGICDRCGHKTARLEAVS